MEEFIADGDGCFRTVLVSRQNAPRMLGDALAGDRLAGAALALITDWFHLCPDVTAADCFLCCVPLTVTPPAFVVAVPERDDPSHGVVGALCVSCSGQSDERIMQSALPAWRKIMPDIRFFDPADISAAGRA
jgi:hypothetical protein